MIRNSIFALLLVTAACGPNAPTDTPRSPTESQQAKPTTTKIELVDTEVLAVDLAHPVQALDGLGEARVFSEAHMVRLTMKGLPTTSGPLDLFVGDSQIREYGGWEGGLYFWVYDPDQIAKLDGGTISYSWEDGPRTNLGMELTMKIDPGAERVREDSLFPNRNRGTVNPKQPAQ